MILKGHHDIKLGGIKSNLKVFGLLGGFCINHKGQLAAGQPGSRSPNYLKLAASQQLFFGGSIARYMVNLASDRAEGMAEG